MITNSLQIWCCWAKPGKHMTCSPVWPVLPHQCRGFVTAVVGSIGGAVAPLGGLRVVAPPITHLRVLKIIPVCQLFCWHEGSDILPRPVHVACMHQSVILHLAVVLSANII